MCSSDLLAAIPSAHDVVPLQSLQDPGRCPVNDGFVRPSAIAYKKSHVATLADSEGESVIAGLVLLGDEPGQSFKAPGADPALERECAQRTLQRSTDLDIGPGVDGLRVWLGGRKGVQGLIAGRVIDPRAETDDTDGAGSRIADVERNGLASRHAFAIGIGEDAGDEERLDRKSTRLNSSHT